MSTARLDFLVRNIMSAPRMTQSDARALRQAINERIAADEPAPVPAAQPLPDVEMKPPFKPTRGPWFSESPAIARTVKECM